MRKMCEPYYGNKVEAWPVGINTDKWRPAKTSKQFDFLIYDKIRWEHDKYQVELIDPLIEILGQKKLSWQFIKYGSYAPDELVNKLTTSKAVIFLCEHETQGLAYQQILSTDTPILAWDRGGYWQDPCYYPHKVKYQPVCSVPYWDDRCGIKFKHVDEFEALLAVFLANLNLFNPRDYILENLTLEKCAEQYLKIFHQVENEQ
jgi:glycosyltransferase involved in cell wall biosynthesis